MTNNDDNRAEKCSPNSAEGEGLLKVFNKLKEG